MKKEKVVRVKKPWGYEIIWAHTGRYVGKVLHINAGHKLSLQYHRKKDETIYVLKGTMQLVTMEKGRQVSIDLKEGQAFRIKPGRIHRFVCIKECDILEASTPELKDVVRIEDLYGRENGAIRR
jgi:mannose-6-phosphate isomerase